MEVGGLDKAEVAIQLDNGKLIGIPWDFDSENIEKVLRAGSESLFSSLGDIPVYSVNPEGKTIQEVLDVKKKRESSFLCILKNRIGLGDRNLKAYKVCKTEYRENKFKFLKDQIIIDFLLLEDSDSAGFIELENGYIITENIMSPHGTGMAGLIYYESLQDFEESCGQEYKRIKK